jgi:hypothetical protein
MEKTEPVDFINRPQESYFIAARFSPPSTEAIRRIINAFELEFGNAVFGMPGEALHVTVLDWISPVDGYEGTSKTELYEQIYDDFDAVMSQVTASTAPITIKFNIVRASPSTIFITGRDNGEFETLRQHFVEKVSLPKDTKTPPQIIHSSLVRFVKEIELSDVERFTASQQLDITETFTHFDLLRSTVEPNLKFEVLKEYKLGG